MAPRVPAKKQVLLSYLQRGVAMVHVDARQPGVVVPPQYADEAHLRLNLSYRYSIADMEIGEDQVAATLSFGGRPFHCVLPWQAIFGITSQASGDGQVWPEDLPVEVAQAATEQPPPGGAPQSAAPARLTAVEPAPPGGRREDSPKPPDGPGRRHLRLVR